MHMTIWTILVLLVFLLGACTSGPLPLLERESGGGAASTETPGALAPEDAAGSAPSGSTQAFPTPSLPQETPPAGAAREFKTDFSRHTVSYSEILSGGPPKDGIPAIDEPQFVGVNEAATWLRDEEPVVLVRVPLAQGGEEVRAYPLQILMWHEIVNDTVGDLPLTITFCPLCNTAIAFERLLDGRTLDFGTTGRLRFSNLIMYDRQTESWWQQAGGDAIAGELAGRQLAHYPATIVAWSDFRTTYPSGKVLSRETGYARDYGRNPYAGYDDVNRSPFLYQGPATSDRLPPMARVMTVDQGGEAVAYPYTVLETQRVVNDEVGGKPVVVFWAEGTASALDSPSVAGGRDVGSAAVYSPDLDGQMLTFHVEDGAIRDTQTGSEWDILGRAVEGSLSGRQLAPVISIDHFWFSWAAFKPETRIYQP